MGDPINNLSVGGGHGFPSQQQYLPVPNQFRQSVPQAGYAGWPPPVGSNIGAYVPLDVPNAGIPGGSQPSMASNGLLGNQMQSGTTANQFNLMYLQQQSQQMGPDQTQFLLAQQQQFMAAMAAGGSRSNASDPSGLGFPYGFMVNSAYQGGMGNTFLPAQQMGSRPMNSHTGMFGQGGTNSAGFFGMQQAAMGCQNGADNSSMYVDLMNNSNHLGGSLAHQMPFPYNIGCNLSQQLHQSQQLPQQQQQQQILVTKQEIPHSSHTNQPQNLQTSVPNFLPSDAIVKHVPEGTPSTPSLPVKSRPQPRSVSLGLLPGEHEVFLSPISLGDLLCDTQAIIQKSKNSNQQTLLSMSNLSQSSPLQPLFHSLLSSVVITGNDTCQVCFEPQKPARFCCLGDFLVQCKDCNLAVHRRCYGVHKVLDEAPTGRRKFLCDLCRAVRLEQKKKNHEPDASTEFSTASFCCLVCDRDTGPRKKTTSGQWIHVYCALLCREVVRVRDYRFMGPFELIAKPTSGPNDTSKTVETKAEEGDTQSNLVKRKQSETSTSPIKTENDGGSLAPDASTGAAAADLVEVKSESPEVCQICQSPKGYFLKCKAEGCEALLHPYCLRSLMHDFEIEGKNQLAPCVELRFNHEASNDNTLACGVICYCPRHAPPQRYCICRRPFDNTTDTSLMVGCDVCGDWLHGSCIGTAAAESAIEADHYQCPRCASQRLHLAMLDREWAHVSSHDEDTYQIRELVSTMTSALSCIPESPQILIPGIERPISTIPITADIGVVVPSHTVPLPFTDLLLIAASWSIRVELLLASDKISPTFLSSTPIQTAAVSDLVSPSVTNACFSPQSETQTNETNKKKILLKKKLPEGKPGNSLLVTPNLTAKPAAPTPLIDLKKKKPLTTALGLSTPKSVKPEVLGKPNLNTRAAGPPVVGKCLMSGQRTNLDNRAIIKKPGIGTSSTTIKKLGDGLAPKKVTAVATSVPSNVKKSLLVNKLARPAVSSGTSPTSMLKKRLGGPLNNKLSLIKSELKTESGLQKRKPLPMKKPASQILTKCGDANTPVETELPLQAVCHLASLHTLLSSADRIPFSLSFWLKNLSNCINRCEAWISAANKAIKCQSIDQLRACLDSHSSTTLSLLYSVKSEPSPIAMAKLPSINRVTRLSASLTIKTSGIVIGGALSQLTTEAVALRTKIAVETFLSLNKAVLENSTSSITVSMLKAVVSEIESRPELSTLKIHEIYSKSQLVLNRIQECTSIVKTLKSASKAQLSEIESLVEEVKTKLPSDADVDLFSLCELLSKGRLLETQIDWSSLKCMRDVYSQVQHMPITSPAFQQLQKSLTLIDAWRRDYQRVVSLMRSIGTEGNDSDKAGHRRNIVVSGQSGFLKDLFTGQDDSNVESQSSAPVDNYTQSQTVEEARQLLNKGLLLEVQCQEIKQLQSWINKCDDWDNSVKTALSNISDPEINFASWDVEGLTSLQKKKPLLPFAVSSELNQNLTLRIDELIKIEKGLLTALLGNKLIDRKKANELLQQLNLLLAGAELTGNFRRITKWRELKNVLEERINKLNEWNGLIEFILNVSDQFLLSKNGITFKKNSEEKGENEQKDFHISNIFELDVILKTPPEFSPSPYSGSPIINPLIDFPRLITAHWYTYSSDEILRLKETVVSSIQFINPDDKNILTTSNLLIGDEFDDDLFEIDSPSKSVVSGIDMIKGICEDYKIKSQSIQEDYFHDDQVESHSKKQTLFIALLKLLLQYTVLSVIQFLMICNPNLITNNPLFPFLKVSIGPILVNLGFDGRSIFGPLIPATTETLKRLVRSGSQTINATSLTTSTTDPELLSDQWTLIENGWRFLLVEPEEELVTRCIARLVGLWILTSSSDESLGIFTSTEVCGGLLNTVLQQKSILGLSNSAPTEYQFEESEMIDANPSANLGGIFPLLSSASAKHRLAVLSVLREFEEICSLHQQHRRDAHLTMMGGRLPLDQFSLESRLKELLQRLTWRLRATKILSVLRSFSDVTLRLTGRSCPVSLDDVCELIDEYDTLVKSSSEERALDIDCTSAQDAFSQPLSDVNETQPKAALSTDDVLGSNLRGELTYFVEEASDWLTKANERLAVAPECALFVPQLLHNWSAIENAIGHIRPQFTLLSISLPNEVMASCHLSCCAGVGSKQSSLAVIFANCSNWDRSTWDKVLDALRADWHFNQTNPNDQRTLFDLVVVPTEALPTALLEIQRLVVLGVAGDVASREVSAGMNGSEPVIVSPMITELPSEQHLQAFQDAIASSLLFCQPVADPRRVGIDHSTPEATVLGQLKSVVDALSTTSPSSTVYSPVYFISPAVSVVQQVFSRSCCNFSIVPAVCSQQGFTWAQSLACCMSQGWFIPPNQLRTIGLVSGDINSNAGILDIFGPKESTRHQLATASKIAVGTKLLEMVSERSRKLKEMFACRPVLCRPNDPACRLLTTQLALCEWTEAAVRALSGMDANNDTGLPSFSSQSSQVQTMDSLSDHLRSKSAIEKLLMLDNYLNKVKEELNKVPKCCGHNLSRRAAFITDWSSAFKVLGDTGEDSCDLGGFLGVEIRERISEIRKMLSKRPETSKMPTAYLLQQSIIFKHSLKRLFTPPCDLNVSKSSAGVILPGTVMELAESKSKWILDSQSQYSDLLSSFEETNRLLEDAENERKRIEAIVLELFRIVFAVFLRGLLSQQQTNTGRDRTTLSNHLISILPQRLFEYLKAPQMVGVNEQAGQWIPLVTSLGMMHITDSIGILVAQIVFDREDLPSAPLVFGESGCTEESLNAQGLETCASDYGNGTGGTSTSAVSSGQGECETREDVISGIPELVFLHPRCLIDLSLSVDLEAASSEPWIAFVTPKETIELSRFFAGLETCATESSRDCSRTAESTKSSGCDKDEMIKELSVQALIHYIVSRVIPENSLLTLKSDSCLIPEVLVTPLRIISWRLKMLPYLFPRVVPYDLLDQMLQEGQQLIPLQDRITAATNIPMPTDIFLAQILQQHQLSQIGRMLDFASNITLPPGISNCIANILPVMCNSPLQIILHQTNEILNRKGLIPSEEERELAGRFDRTAVVIFEFARHQREVSLSNAAAAAAMAALPDADVSKNRPVTHIPIQTLMLTAKRILREQLVMHPAVESLCLYLEELAVWEQTTRHVLERLQARQEIQHKLLEKIRLCCESDRQLQLQQQQHQRPNLNSFNVSCLTAENIQLIWNAYGMSSALFCAPTLPPSALLEFPKSLAEFNSLKALCQRGEELSCSIRGANLEALQKQLKDVIRALEHLNAQAVKFVSTAILSVENEIGAKGSRLPTSEVEKHQLELFLEQSLFADLPSHPQTKDLFRRVISLEYFATLAFGKRETLDLILDPSVPIPEIYVELPAATNVQPFDIAISHHSSDVDSNEVSDVTMAYSESSKSYQGYPLVPGRMPWTSLVIIVQEQCQLQNCPVVSPVKGLILQHCWLAAVRLLFVVGEPNDNPNSPIIREAKAPSFKTIQSLHNMGKQLFENHPIVPVEMKLLKVLLTAAKAFLSEARVSVDSWVKFRLLLGCYPVLIKDEMRVLRTKLQQKFSNVFIDVISSNKIIQEVQIFKDGQLKQRYVPPPGIPDCDGDGVPESQRKGPIIELENEEQSEKTAKKANPIISILQHASAKHNLNFINTESNITHPGLSDMAEPGIALERKVRSSFESCIRTIFNDGEESAKQREKVLYDAVGKAVDEEYFKGLQRLIVKKLQQIVSVRKAVPNSGKGRRANGESSLDDLLGSSSARPVASASSAQKQQQNRSQPNASSLSSTRECDGNFNFTWTNESEVSSTGGSPITNDDVEAFQNAETNGLQLTPLESAGFLWSGLAVGTSTDQPIMSLPLWIVPLFSPIPSELRLSFRNCASCQLEKELSVSQFAGHMTGGADAAIRLHVLIGADWSSETPENRAIINKIRPRTLKIIHSLPRSQLSQSEVESLQAQAVSDAVKVLSFNTQPAAPDAHNLNIRLWIVPPVPSLTETLLPSGFPKSSQIVFGVLEIYNERPLSVPARNHALGSIRSVATSTTQAIAQLQQKQKNGIADLPPEAIPKFTGLRITVPQTTFEFVAPVQVTTLQASTAVETLPIDPEPQGMYPPACSSPFFAGPGRAALGISSGCENQPEAELTPSRIPKRARTGDVQSILQIGQWGPTDVDGGRLPTKVPPWQQARENSTSPPWKDQSRHSQTATTSTIQEDPYGSGQSISAPMATDGHHATVVTHATTLLASTAKSTPPWLQRKQGTENTTGQAGGAPAALPFAVPDALRSLLQGAAAQLRSRPSQQ